MPNKQTSTNQVFKKRNSLRLGIKKHRVILSILFATLVGYMAFLLPVQVENIQLDQQDAARYAKVESNMENLKTRLEQEMPGYTVTTRLRCSKASVKYQVASISCTARLDAQRRLGDQEDIQGLQQDVKKFESVTNTGQEMVIDARAAEDKLHTGFPKSSEPSKDGYSLYLVDRTFGCGSNFSIQNGAISMNFGCDGDARKLYWPEE